MNDHPALDDGYYVGVRATVIAYRFKLPKAKKSAPKDLTLDQLWERFDGSPKVVVEDAPAPKVTGEKTTRHSGWFRVSAAKQVSDKAYAAPDIYRAAGGDDPSFARECVKVYKQHAEKVLGRCADNGTFVDESIAKEINQKSCLVHEMKVILLKVSSTDNGGRFDENTKKWYAERTMRKFYVLKAPLQNLLAGFAAELANPDTNVSAEGRLVVTRESRTVTREGRVTRSNSFKIQTAEFYGDEDAGLQKVLDRLRKRLIEDHQS